MNRYIYISCLTVLTFALLVSGCTDYKGDVKENIDPNIILFNNPVDGDTLGAAPIICWSGFDSDGKVYTYEYIDLPKAQTGTDQGVPESAFNDYVNNPQLLADIEYVENEAGDEIYWYTDTTGSTCDTIFLKLLIEGEITEHLFCVRALDQEGGVSDIECATFYRSNLPPDSITITTDSLDGAEFWILDDFTYSWDGIRISWGGADPDNSILLEYYWWLEDMSSNVVLTSHLDDSLGGVGSGTDSTDGWIRSTSTNLRGPVPTGDYRFIVKIRDDAFIEGAADTATFQLAHPVFDISREEVLQQYADGTYPDHKVMLIDQNNATFFPPFGVDYTLESIRYFYDSLFHDMIPTKLAGCTLIVNSSSNSLDISRQLLAEYNILYILDQEPATSGKFSGEFLEELLLYVQVGGRIVLDGRNIFLNEVEVNGQLPSFGYFGIQDDYTGSNSPIFQEGISSRDTTEYPNLVVDSSRAASIGLRSINRLGARPPAYTGSPYVEILYRFGLTDAADTTDEGDDYRLGPVAQRFVTPSFRTAYFAFPLYMMENDEGQVDRVIESTIDFIKQQVIPPEEEDEQ